jgi:4-hydroxythreonine-4-phosphate dehydrogenase
VIFDSETVVHKKANVIVCWEEEVEIKPGEVTEVGGKYAFKSINKIMFKDVSKHSAYSGDSVVD